MRSFQSAFDDDWSTVSLSPSTLLQTRNKAILATQKPDEGEGIIYSCCWGLGFTVVGSELDSELGSVLDSVC